jgi:hypothetical protein
MKKYITILILWFSILELVQAQQHEFAFGSRFMKTQGFSADYSEPILTTKFLKTVYTNQNKTDYYLRFNAKNIINEVNSGYNSPSLGLSYKYNFKVNRLKIKVGITSLLYNQFLENNKTMKLDIINIKDTVSYFNTSPDNRPFQTTEKQEIYKQFSRFSVPFELRYEIKNWDIGLGLEYYQAYIYNYEKSYTVSSSKPSEYSSSEKHLDSSGIAANVSVIKWHKSFGFEFGINKELGSKRFEGYNDDNSNNQKSPLKTYFNLIYRPKIKKKRAKIL